MTTTDDGTYLEIDGRPAVRFQRFYPHPVERVWRAVTAPDELRAWFPSPEVSYEPRVGGSIRLRGDEYDPEGSEGRVLVWEPPTRFGFEWGDDELHLHLTEVDGGCLLELLDRLDQVGAAARNGAGWTLCLDRLSALVEDRPAPQREFGPLLESFKGRSFPDDGWLPHGL